MTAVKKAIDKGRRGFLKMLPAAPLAEPSIAQEVTKFGFGAQPAPYFVGGLTAQAAGQVDMGYLLEQRNKLERAARGEFSDEDEHYLKPRKDLALALHYDGLRSLSPVMRAHLHARQVANQQREERKFWAAQELKSFIKNHLGGIA